MKIIVAGSSGMLGSAVVPYLTGRGHEVVGADLRRPDSEPGLDVSDLDALRRFEPLRSCSLVINLAAATNVDQCEKDPDMALRNNAWAPQLLAHACAERDIPLVQVSTAAVFAGNKKTEPYTEYDETAPLSVYARSKLRGEQAVRRTARKHFIVRAGWMMGGAAEEKKFVGKIVSQILVEKKRKLMAVSDKRGSPTYTVDFAANLMELIGTGRYGTYHMANHGTCTRFEMTRRIVELLGVDAIVEPVPSSYFPLPAPRPDSECLRNFKLELLGIDRMPSWEGSLGAYLKVLVPALKR